MKFLSNLFALCALLSIMWLCGGTAIWQIGVQSAQPSNEILTDQSIANAAKSIAGGLGIGFFACTGLPAAAFFALLAFICNNSYQAERRHQEILATQMNRNDTLGNMATIQLAQAQMQHDQMRRSNYQNPYAPPHIDAGFPDEKPTQDEFEMRRQEFIRQQQKKRQDQIDKFKPRQ